MSDSTAQRREPKGVTEHVGGNAKYLFVKYGCLCEVSKTPVEGWRHPVNQKTGEEITDKWIKSPKSIEMWVDSLEWYDRKHGTEVYQGWKMHGNAGGVNYILDLPLNNEATKKIMFSAPNINFRRPLEIAAWTALNERTNKMELAVWLQQDGETILQFYKKDDMKDCPPPVQRAAVGGGSKWDWSDTDAFLWGMMEQQIAPLIKQCAAERASSTPAPARPTPPDEPGVPTHTGGAAPTAPSVAPAANAEDDIPF